MMTSALSAWLERRAYGDRDLTTVGVGACRERGDESSDVVVEAIRSGCNVFLTAPHYHQGTHQRALGAGARAAITAQLCDRESLFVGTKVGRVPELVAQTVDALGYGRVKALIEQDYIARGLFTWDELAHGDHTLAPPYVRHSVQQSLGAMELAYVDCVFLDTPEQQLRVVGRSGYTKRVYAAIEALESMCSAGLVGSYGIETANASSDLRELVDLARAVAGDAHKLRALQVPLSLLRQDVLASGLLTRAADLGLFVFATACLDGGTPGYQIAGELDAELGMLSDASIAVRWVRSAPDVGTAVFGTRDVRHLRANLAAARLPALETSFYASPDQGAA